MRPLPILFASLLAIASSANAAMTFFHPGGLDSKADLDFVKKKIKLGEQPWSGEFAKMKGYCNRNPNPATTINANDDGAANSAKTDAQAAYADALAWYFTDDETYAKKGIAILNAWQGLTSITATDPKAIQQNRLLGGWIGALFGPAADILLGYKSWDPKDIAAVKAMFKKALYPQLNPASSWNGNVDLTQMDAMMNIAVFMEDEAFFNIGLSRLKKRNPAYFYMASDGGVPTIPGDNGDIPTFWFKPTKWVDGLTQETCRDGTHHAQFSMASVFHMAEAAWNQGVDVYTPNQARFVAALELMGLQISSGNMQNVCSDNATKADRFNTFEVAYNHYHNRKGVSLPNTLKAITQELRPKGGMDWNIFFETLTHADLDAPPWPPVASSIAGHTLVQSSLRVSLQPKGFCEILSNTTEPLQLSVVGLDGRRVSQSIVNVIAGQSQSVSLGIDRAPSGIYLVQVRGAQQNTVLKVSK